MIAWHVGAVLLLFRWIFQDPKVDVRFLALGAIIPDLIDVPLGTVLFPQTIGTSEAVAHTLLAPTAVAIVVLASTRRGRRRRAWMALVVGWFFHLLLDGMWTSSEVFFWPLFGIEFPAGPTPFWGGIADRALADPLRWVTEAIGATYLIWLWRSVGLSDRTKRSQFLSDGRLPDRVDEVTP